MQRQSEHPNPPQSPAPRTPIDKSSWRHPWVQLKTFSYHPTIYPAMIREASADARSGDLVNVYDKTGQPFGAGLYNPKARVPLRVLFHGEEPYSEQDLETSITRAINLRLNDLKLPEATDAFRVIHSDGDALSGLIVDRFNDVLSVSVHSYGVFLRLERWLSLLHQQLGTSRMVIEIDEHIARREGIPLQKIQSDNVRSVKIRENGVRYEVNFSDGHKTGFFCDQRNNRRLLTQWTPGRTMLDLCCYTGGFALSALLQGKATDVTGVDLDEKAIAQAKRNANLNQARIDWVHCDAFSYARQMQRNGRKWEVVVLDPPKLVMDREDEDGGRKKYEDLNQLALYLVETGGIFVTCSCSGLVSAEEFERMVIRSAHRAGRRLQFLDRTGAGEDHPVMSNCPESRYLKLLWARVW